MEEIEKIIIDIGTYETKVGFAGHEIPYKSFPSIYGYIKSSNVMGLEPERLNGSEAKMKRGNYHIKNLIQNQKVVDWDEMISFLEHCFYNQARTDTEEVIVALSEYPLTSEKERMKKTEIIFETFNSLGLYLGNSAFLSLVASGRDTGLVLDSGYEMTYVVPILRGSPLNPSIVSDNYGGKTITEFLLKKLRERTGLKLNKSYEIDSIRDIKENYCYIAKDFTSELLKLKSEKLTQTEFVLPDGTLLSIGDEKINCIEIMFNPVEDKFEPVHELLNVSIRRCDLDFRKDLYQNIVLSGSNTLFKGFSERLKNEMIEISPKSENIYVINNQKYSTFLGASIWSTISTFGSNCLLKDEYNEYGPKIINWKMNNI